jgi:hypothetical protein
MTPQRIYRTDTETYYLDSTGQAWLIDSQAIKGIQSAPSVPNKATQLPSSELESPRYEEAVNAIEHLNYLDSTR